MIIIRSCQKRFNHPKVIAAAVKRGETDVEVGITRGSSEQFSFRENCFLYGERITVEFIEAQKRKRPDNRNSVITVEKMTVNGTISQVFEKEAMTGLIEEMEGEVPDRRNIKNRLFAIYRGHIVIAEMKNKENVVCFKNTGYKVLTNEWYEQTTKSDPHQERRSVVRAAADIVREVIRFQVYNTSEFMPSNDFLQDVDSVIPETLKVFLETSKVFLETLILKKKRGILDVYRRKCVALAHSIIACVRPHSFVSSSLHGVGTYLYHKFGSRHLIHMLESLGFSASYSPTTVIEPSAIMRPDKLQLEGNTFIQFCFDNADLNVNTVLWEIWRGCSERVWKSNRTYQDEVPSWKRLPNTCPSREPKLYAFRSSITHPFKNSVEKIMTGHSYARAVRVYTLAHLALAGEVVKTLNLTERENLVVRDNLSDSKNILRAHEDKEFQAIVQKFNDAFQNLKENAPTAEL
ncbi:hypothetical protein JTB14_027860 [Gonioctena quinquepunctata]|nr:hypothetical protein JTB14_027860 [Gonioctena quinquepunctata]